MEKNVQHIMDYYNEFITVNNHTQEEFSNIILNSDNDILIDTSEQIQHFFDFLHCLNLKYDMGMEYWEKTEYKDKNIITYHNNICKCYYNFIYDKYIKKIREKLEKCKVEFYYMELREYRYNKTKEIVFIFRT